MTNQKTTEEKIKEILKPIAEEGIRVYEGTEKLFDIRIVENALQEYGNWVRKQTLEEAIASVKDYFKGLIVIPDPQATGKNILSNLEKLKDGVDN